MTTGGAFTRELPVLLRDAGLDLDAFPALKLTWKESVEQLERARDICSAFSRDSAVAFACGSLGRREYTPGSDLDVAFVHGPEMVSAEAETTCTAMHAALRDVGFDVSDTSMFGRPAALGDLVANVGGDKDTSRNLTFRALIITEGEWLCSPAIAKDYRERIVQTYSEGEVSRGRYLTSLTNDLHRYYRTLCVDYRWKVEGDKKRGGWAIRNVKLRHSRKLWHLGTICAECAAFLQAQERPRARHDDLLSAALQSSSFAKVLLALALVGEERRAAPLLAAYDQYLEKMRDTRVRDHLDSLPHEKRDDPTFQELRENARRFDAASQMVVWALLNRNDVAAHLLRYGLL